MDERTASQNFINLNIGQLLNLLDNVNKNYVRKLEKLNKSFANNKYDISFNNIYIYIDINSSDCLSAILLHSCYFEQVSLDIQQLAHLKLFEEIDVL